METDREFPPNPGQFRALCKRTAEQANNEAEPLPALEHLAAESGTGLKWLAFMINREIIPRPTRLTHKQARAMEDAAPDEFAAMQHAHDRETRSLRGRMGL